MADIQLNYTGAQINNALQTIQNNTLLTRTDAASTYLTQTNAASTYLTQTNANNNFLKITDAESTYLPLIGGQLTGNLTTTAFINTNGSYAMEKWSATTVSAGNTTVKSIQITTHGRPVLLICSGDNNPTSSGAWHYIFIKRGDTALALQTDQSPANSSNVPFCLCYLDIVPAGTYTYTATLQVGSGTIQFGEGGDANAPQFIAFEI